MEMITYTEITGVKPFNWFVALSAKRVSNWYILKVKSKSWTTCACGNQCNIIPRTHGGMPVDYELKSLGYLFHNVVTKKNKKKALEILEQIEIRSAYLIKEISCKSK